MRIERNKSDWLVFVLSVDNKGIDFDVVSCLVVKENTFCDGFCHIFDKKDNNPRKHLELCLNLFGRYFFFGLDPLSCFQKFINL